MGSNSFSSLTFTPSAARLAQLVYTFVVPVLHLFMMVGLLSFGLFFLQRGMTHHCLFGKSFSLASTLPLLWTNFRYLGYPFQNRAVNGKVSNSIAICLMYHWSEKGLDRVICVAFFRTDIPSRVGGRRGIIV